MAIHSSSAGRSWRQNKASKLPKAIELVDLKRLPSEYLFLIDEENERAFLVEDIAVNDTVKKGRYGSRNIYVVCLCVYCVYVRVCVCVYVSVCVCV
mmetsp:Transcript_17432/g.28622  ORF Transcript_17432/g.28622 Transcript_17432/m.28622 type:complete len:96 (+) Transcript_17432:2-289(+)